MTIKYPRQPLIQTLKKYFEILNSLASSEQCLTEKEIITLIEFLLLPPKFDYQRFSSVAKHKVIESLDFQYDWKLSMNNLNNKLYAIIPKGAIRRDTDKVLYIADHILLGAQALISSHTKKENFSVNIQLVSEKSKEA